MNAANGCWQESANASRLDCGPLAGAVRLDQTSASFVVQRWQGRPVNGLTVLSYFGPSVALEPLVVSDTYIRGSDFVATYAETHAQKIASQLYWRAAFEEQFQAVKVELVLSVKTDVLDSQPVSRVHSLINLQADAWRCRSLTQPRFERIELASRRAETFSFAAEDSREQLFLFRLPEHGLSFAQFVHPTDFVAAQVALDTLPPYSLLASLFPERLERGVIRRARVGAWFLPSANDQDVATELARRFVDEPLPLTA